MFKVVYLPYPLLCWEEKFAPKFPEFQYFLFPGYTGVVAYSNNTYLKYLNFEASTYQPDLYFATEGRHTDTANLAHLL